MLRLLRSLKQRTGALPQTPRFSRHGSGVRCAWGGCWKGRRLPGAESPRQLVDFGVGVVPFPTHLLVGDRDRTSRRRRRTHTVWHRKRQSDPPTRRDRDHLVITVFEGQSDQAIRGPKRPSPRVA